MDVKLKTLWEGAVLRDAWCRRPAHTSETSGVLARHEAVRLANGNGRNERVPGELSRSILHSVLGNLLYVEFGEQT